MATYLDLIKEAQSRSGNSDSDTLASIKRWINFRLQEICSFLWRFQLTKDFFETVADYSTGTISVTNLSATMIITTGVVSSGWAGRKIRIGTDNIVYKISSVDTGANTVTIDQTSGYLGTTDTDATYVVFQDEYIQPYDCLGVYALAIEGKKLDYEATLPSIRNDAQPDTAAKPTEWCVIGNTTDSHYSTGTITVSSKTVTLTGGTFPSDVKGRWISSEAQAIGFKIASRTSDSVVVLDRTGLIASDSNYAIDSGNKPIIRFNCPADDIYRVERWYWRRLPDLVNNYDLVELPMSMHRLLQNGVYLSFLEHQREFTTALALAKAEYENGIYRERVSEDKANIKGRTPHMRTGYEKTTVGSWN